MAQRGLIHAVVASAPEREQTMSEYEREARRTKLDELREAGVDPYPARVGERTSIEHVVERYRDCDGAKLEADLPEAAICGRVMAVRSFGKLIFLQVLENGHELQVSVKKADVSPETFAFFKKLDIADFIRVEGVMWRTRTEELTLDARSAQMLSKTLRPLPEKWAGLSDVEARFRQRYLDLLVNEDSRRVAIARSRVLRSMRANLDARGFLEVETPVLQPLYGGAAARPFTTHHNTYDQELYLRISDELYLKRLIVAGMDRVYEISHNFRNEGVSRKHNPEFTMMECYEAYADYRDMMNLTESMLKAIAEEVTGGAAVEYQGQTLDFSGEWPRIAMRDAILEHAKVDILAAEDLVTLQAAVKEAGLPSLEAPTWGQLVDELFSEYVEPLLVQPTFVIDYPVDLSPLAKRSPDDPRLVERFEVFVAGMEVGNAFSELNDPVDQRGRFEDQAKAGTDGDEEAHPMDEDYLTAMEHGMPPTGGLGIGVDRLVMVLTDAPSLREVILFPHMRPVGDS
jgi:lysyl-tRNA synthetase class 2